MEVLEMGKNVEMRTSTWFDGVDLEEQNKDARQMGHVPC